MRILIVPVAGQATRFSESVGDGKKHLKCLFNYGNVHDSILYKLLHLSDKFEKIIVVGGFMFEELKNKITDNFSDLSEKIEIVYNENFAKYGTGYSLFAGLKKAMEFAFSEVVLAEGDLAVNSNGFEKVVESDKDVVTASSDDILASKSVVLVVTEADKIRYAYDTNHGSLNIIEPFRAIFNSAQIWKFSNPQKLRQKFATAKDADWQGTNLVFIQNYFSDVNFCDCELVKFSVWVNCNTIDDFNKIKILEL